MPFVPTYIDLFAGCGGLSVGFHEAGWKGLFAVERDPSAFLTLKANLIDSRKHFDWPDWLAVGNWDIKNLLAQNEDNLLSLRGRVDLVVGGPPCQGFSIAGRRRESDERNNLVFSYLHFVELVQPRAIIFENVRGFTMKSKGETENGCAYSQIVVRKLRELGYLDAQGEIVDMSTYGVPQRRQRFILVATLQNVAGRVFEELGSKSPEFLSSKGIPAKNGVGAAMSDLRKCHGLAPCPDTKGFQSGIAGSADSKLQGHLRLDNAHGKIPDSHRFVNHTPPMEVVFSKLLAQAPRNQSIAGEERESYGLKKRSATVLSEDEPAPTITTIPDDLVHYSEPRVLTVRECARLQSFPDWFEFKGQYTTGGKQRVHETPRYTQVGNAVPPLFAELMAVAAKEVLKDG